MITKIKKGDLVYTPRFLEVRIEKVFNSPETARKQGFTEPTHFENYDFDIRGKVTGKNLMIFAAVKKTVKL